MKEHKMEARDAKATSNYGKVSWRGGDLAAGA